MKKQRYYMIGLCAAWALGTLGCGDDDGGTSNAGGAGGSAAGASGSAGSGGEAGASGTAGSGGEGGASGSAGSAGAAGSGGAGGSASAGSGGGSSEGPADAGALDASAPPDGSVSVVDDGTCNIVADQLLLPDGTSCTLTPEQMEAYNLAGTNQVSCSGGIASWGGIGAPTLSLNGLEISCVSP